MRPRGTAGTTYCACGAAGRTQQQSIVAAAFILANVLGGGDVFPEGAHLTPDFHNPRADATPGQGSNRLKASSRRENAEEAIHQHTAGTRDMENEQRRTHSLGVGYSVQVHPLRRLRRCARALAFRLRARGRAVLPRRGAFKRLRLSLCGSDPVP